MCVVEPRHPAGDPPDLALAPEAQHLEAAPLQHLPGQRGHPGGQAEAGGRQVHRVEVHVLAEAQPLQQPGIVGVVVGHHGHRRPVLEAVHQDAAAGDPPQQHRPAQQLQPPRARPVEHRPHQGLRRLRVVLQVEEVEVGAGGAVLGDVARVLHHAGPPHHAPLAARQQEVPARVAEERMAAAQQAAHVQVEPGDPLGAVPVQALGELDEIPLQRSRPLDPHDLYGCAHFSRHPPRSAGGAAPAPPGCAAGRPGA